MFDYTNKVVAITGASSGLGKQMAEGFAKCHANLVLLARRVERLEASKRCLETIKTSNIEEREYIKYEPYKDAINKYIKEKGIE